MKFLKIKSGFTLVETLVAIAVLMIAIAGPLTIANRGLTAALYAKNQSIASYLAQEQVEYVKNLRNNALKNDSNNPILDDMYIDCQSTSPCIIDAEDIFVPNGWINRSNCGTDALFYADCRLHISNASSNGGYVYDTISPNQPTLFYRFFYLTDGGSGVGDYQLTVVVAWREGIVDNEVRLHSILANAILE